MEVFRIATATALLCALVSGLLLLRPGRAVLSELVSGGFVFGVLVGTVTSLLSGAWCYFVPGNGCLPGDALLGGPFGFSIGVLWFSYWWWHEARPD